MRAAAATEPQAVRSEPFRKPTIRIAQVPSQADIYDLKESLTKNCPLSCLGHCCGPGRGTAAVPQFRYNITDRVSPRLFVAFAGRRCGSEPSASLSGHNCRLGSEETSNVILLFKLGQLLQLVAVWQPTGKIVAFRVNR